MRNFHKSILIFLIFSNFEISGSIGFQCNSLKVVNSQIYFWCYYLPTARAAGQGGNENYWFSNIPGPANVNQACHDSKQSPNLKPIGNLQSMLEISIPSNYTSQQFQYYTSAAASRIWNPLVRTLTTSEGTRNHTKEPPPTVSRAYNRTRSKATQGFDINTVRYDFH